jgi:hypothetical protein
LLCTEVVEGREPEGFVRAQGAMGYCEG